MSDEEQIMIPELDTPLGQAGDALTKAVAELEEINERTEALKKKFLDLMVDEGIDKVRLNGDGFNLTVRHEHVDSHEKLRMSKAAAKTKEESEEY